MRRRFVRNVPWFRAWTAEEHLVPDSRISWVREDSLGRLWIVVHVPDERWTPATGPRGIDSPADFDRLYDTVIELLDPATARVIASKRFPHVISLLRDGLAWSHREDADGRTLMDIWHLHLAGAAR